MARGDYFPAKFEQVGIIGDRIYQRQDVTSIKRVVENAVDAILNSSDMVWMGIGSVIGGVIGAIFVYMVAEGKGFREGTLCMMDHHEKISLANSESNVDLVTSVLSEDIPAPEEMDEVRVKEQDKLLVKT